LLRSKDEALKMVKHFIREVENQPTMKIKMIKRD